MTTPRLTADQIAALFAERLPFHGGYISNKQGRWLMSTASREAGVPRSRSMGGYLADGREWVCSFSGNANGAFSLRLISVEDQERARRAVVNEGRKREVADAMRVAFEAGDRDEVIRLAQEMAALA